MKRPTALSIVLGIILGGLFGGLVWFTYDTTLSADSSILGGNTHVAVFLDTNQVFFGTVAALSGDYIVLKNTYYLVQSGDNANPNFVLQKSGSELHGPKDQMHINRDHVLLIQPLRDDSQVVSTINQYEAALRDGSAQQQPQAPAPVAPAPVESEQEE